MFRVCCVGMVLLASVAWATNASVEREVSARRREQIEAVKKLISLSANPKEQSALLFRLGELSWEESRFSFDEANRKDVDLTESDKAELLTRQKQYARLAIEQYAKLIQQYPDFDRSDEVLFLLGTYLMQEGQDLKALVAFKRLVEKHPKSKYLPDAWLAFGEYFFNKAKGNHADLEKALAAYKKAAEFSEGRVYAFALYKQGWCSFNLGDYSTAKDTWKAVVLMGVEKDGGSKKDRSLVR